MKTCIAVLTRGYKDPIEYSTLCKRNESITNYLEDKTIPFLIFHEGNISMEHQTMIQDKSPELTMHFIDIAKDGKAFRKDKNNIPHLSARSFDVGYRHMCHFWFVDFWDFVEDYDVVIRIDEDCIMESSLDMVIKKVTDPESTASLWTGVVENDMDFVCIGLNQFTRNFIETTTKIKSPMKYPPSGPYTNFFVMRLDRLRSNQILRQYMKAVSESNNIYLYRWGDLPLWGEAVFYILGKYSLVVDKEIRYYHGTHDLHVNTLPQELTK